VSKKNLTLTQRRIIDKLSTLLSVDENIGIAEVIRLLRKRFCMTQKQLAKRAGMPQSYISKMESGELEPTLKTIKKIFEVFSSDVIILPIARSSFDDVIKKQAIKFAKKNLEYVKGTMSLERQLPEPDFLKDLLEEEVKHLVYSGTTKIWDI